MSSHTIAAPAAVLTSKDGTVIQPSITESSQSKSNAIIVHQARSARPAHQVRAPLRFTYPLPAPDALLPSRGRDAPRIPTELARLDARRARTVFDGVTPSDDRRTRRHSRCITRCTRSGLRRASARSCRTRRRLNRTSSSCPRTKNASGTASRSAAGTKRAATVAVGVLIFSPSPPVQCFAYRRCRVKTGFGSSRLAILLAGMSCVLTSTPTSSSMSMQQSST